MGMRGANIAELAMDTTWALMKGSRVRVRSILPASPLARLHISRISASVRSIIPEPWETLCR